MKDDDPFRDVQACDIEVPEDWKLNARSGRGLWVWDAGFVPALSVQSPEPSFAIPGITTLDIRRYGGGTLGLSKNMMTILTTILTIMFKKVILLEAMPIGTITAFNYSNCNGKGTIATIIKKVG